MAEQQTHLGTRLSTTATTGWIHWFHGELWLFQDGILRVPIGWLKSICCVGYFLELRNPRTRTFSAAEFSQLISDPRNLWIPRDAIESASLHFSPFAAYDLHFALSDGRSRQLLTMPWYRIYLPLQSALHEWLGERFVSDTV